MLANILANFSALITSLLSFRSSKAALATQERIAFNSTQKDLFIHANMIATNQMVAELQLQRIKLERLLNIVCQIQTENSMTASYLDSSEDISVAQFRLRYREHMKLLNEATCIVQIYYPDCVQFIENLRDHLGCYRGLQEVVLKTDITQEREGYQHAVNAAVPFTRKIWRECDSVKSYVGVQSAQLNRPYTMGEIARWGEHTTIH